MRERFQSILNGYNFRFGNYINGGFELIKKDFASILVAYLLCMLIAFIPFCAILGIGNFYKVLQRIDRGEQANVGEIFDFKDFLPYFKFQIVVIALVFALLIPIQMFMIPSLMFWSNASDQISTIGVLGSMSVFIVIILIFIVLDTAATFFVTPLISLFGATNMRDTFTLSWQIAKKNLLQISLFMIATGLISQIGILLCGVGLLLTAPLAIVMKYVASKDILYTQNNVQN